MGDRSFNNANARVLVAPGDTALGRLLVKLIEAEGRGIIAAFEGEIPGTGEDEHDTLLLQRKWNRRSLLSARNLVLEGLNALEEINVAIVIHECRQDERSIHELSPTSIERIIDDSVKGTFFLLRELMSYFVRKGTGTVAMVHYSPGDYTKLPLDAALSAGFYAATDSLSTLYQNEAITINGFECSRERPEEFAGYILQTLSGKAATTNGKWYRYGAMARLFH